MISVDNLTVSFGGWDLFREVSFLINAKDRIGLVGKNGAGKSTMLKVLIGEQPPSSGTVSRNGDCTVGYLPQQMKVADTTTLFAETESAFSEVIGLEREIEQLNREIAERTDYESEGYEKLLHRLNDATDRFHILGGMNREEEVEKTLLGLGFQRSDFGRATSEFSGGWRMRIELAKLLLRRPSVFLLDEPTNHLDRTGRDRLYDYIRTCKATLIVVSHDTYLLNLLDRTCELSKKGLKTYGGNYNFYREQKRIEDSALEQRIDSEQAALRLARKKAQEIAERQQKRFSQGERNKDRLPRILRKGAKDRGETTISKLREKHSDIVGLNEKRLNDLRRQRGTACRFKIDFDDALLHNGKLLIAADGVNFGYDRERPLWRIPLDLEIRSGERIRLTGNNGSGKTTLVRLLTGELFPTAGEIRRTDFSYVCLDQEYSLVDTPQTVLELAQKYNRSNLCDHEIKMRLKRVLFAADTWDTSCNALSGGEKMRLCLCCLMISNHVPDLFILDEPTNNLDLSSLAVLADTIGDYRGTLLVISHDRNFTDEIGITKTVELG